MKNNILMLTLLLAISACGGSSDSSGSDTNTGGEGSGSSNGNDCVVVNDTITIANGASCDLTSEIVSTYSLTSASVDTSSAVSCDANGSLTVGFFTAGSGSSTLNNLTFSCSGS